MAFDIGGLAGGLTSGLDAGSQIMQRRQQMQAYQQMQAARAAAARSMSGGQGAPGPGGAPSGAGGSSPAPAAAPQLGNTSPDPMMGRGPPPVQMGGGGGGGGAPGPQPMPMPGARPMPQASAQQAPALSPPPGGGALSAVAQPTGGPQSRDALQNVTSIVKSIKQANPQIDAATLFAAAEEQIKLMKGVEPEMKDFMVLQAQTAGKMAELQTRLQEAQMKIDGMNQRNAATNDTRREVATTSADASGLIPSLGALG